jgi:hypothetical protein
VGALHMRQNMAKKPQTLVAQFNTYFNSRRLMTIIWMLLGVILAHILY